MYTYAQAAKKLFDRRLCCTFLRTHCLPALCIAVGQAEFQLPARSCRVLQGLQAWQAGFRLWTLRQNDYTPGPHWLSMLQA